MVEEKLSQPPSGQRFLRTWEEMADAAQVEAGFRGLPRIVGSPGS